MPTANILKNRKKFLKYILQDEIGEKIVNGSADGEVCLIKDYKKYVHDSNSPQSHNETPTWRRMTLFPTNKRIVTYQARSGLKHDIYAEIPYQDLYAITFMSVNDNKRSQCITEFIAKDDSPCSSIIFRMDSSSNPYDIDEYKNILRGISKVSHIRIEDYSTQ